jgi:transposase-like protein
MAKYSEKLKQSMATKILTPGGPSALSLAGKTGISQSTLSKWVREYKQNGEVIVSDIQRRPNDWSKIEKFQAILDCEKLSTTELGLYLRKQGLTTAHLDKWKKDFISGEERSGVGRPAKNPDIKKLEKKLRETERNLLKKDRALAETAALLVLKKKAQAIWGDPEDEK